MTPEIMNQRLAEGISPKKISEEKWTLITMKHRENPDERISYDVWGAYSCALCSVVMCPENQFRIICDICPLYQAGYGCNTNGSPWRQYESNPCAETALAMATIIHNLEDD